MLGLGILCMYLVCACVIAAGHAAGNLKRMKG